MPRKKDGLTAITLRFREDLRAKLAQLAAGNATSLNSEIIDRLNRSVRMEDELGGKESAIIPVMGWQPIDTAPRNPGDIGETWLIGWNAEWDYPIPIYWFWHGWTTPDQAVINYGDASEGLYKILPTHWTPFPNPPA